MSKDDFDVLNDKSMPHSQEEETKTQTSNFEGDDLVSLDEYEPVEAEDKESVGEEEPNTVDAQVDESDSISEVDNATRKWKWDFVNTLLSTTSLGLIALFVTHGNLSFERDNTKMATSYLTQQKTSITQLRGIVLDQKEQIVGKASNEELIKQKDLTNSKFTALDQELVQLENEMSSLATSLKSNHNTDSYAPLEEVSELKAQLLSMKRKQNALRNQILNLEANTKKLVAETQQTKVSSPSQVAPALLTEKEMHQHLGGVHLLGVNVINGEPLAVFSSPSRGAFAAEKNDHIGDLKIIRITEHRVDFQSDDHMFGSLTVS